MKLIFKFSLLCFLIILCCQCSMNKESYLKDFEKFVSKTEKNVIDLSDTQWEKVQTEFKAYNEKYYEQFKDQLTANDKIQIGFLKSKFSSFYLKREANKLKEQMKIEK